MWRTLALLPATDKELMIFGKGGSGLKKKKKGQKKIFPQFLGKKALEIHSS